MKPFKIFSRKFTLLLVQDQEMDQYNGILIYCDGDGDDNVDGDISINQKESR